MEIVPSSRKFEKAENSIRNYSKTDKDIEFSINQRPTIKVNLYIDHHDNKAHYLGINHYESINKAGIISSIQNQQKMPVISVIVKDITDETDWVKDTLNTIVEYEWNDNLTKEEQKELCHSIMRKKFPCAIPADILYGRKTNEIINLTIHGYPVIATCLDNPAINLPFKEHFSLHMDDFNKKPSYLINLGMRDQVEKQLKEVGLIDDLNHHDPNRFISIDKLLLEDKNIPKIFHYLKQRETGHKISKIASQEKLPNITRDVFVPQQIDPDIDGNENARMECIIS